MCVGADTINQYPYLLESYVHYVALYGSVNSNELGTKKG